MSTWLARPAWAAGLTLALMAVAGPVMAQGEEPGDAATQAPAPFSARVVCTDQEPASLSEGGEEQVAPGLTVMRLGTPTWQMTVESATDPRLPGAATFALNGDLYWDGPSVGEAASPSLADVLVGTLRIQTDDGAWEGTTYLLAIADQRQVDADAVVLVGSGAYAGLVALTEMRQGAHPCEWDLRGVLLTGELPAAPILPTE